MKKIIVLILLAVAPMLALAQGTLYGSNLNLASVSSEAIGSDAWVAQPFVTGNNAGGYALISIQLLMDATTGNPGDFMVSIYNAANPNPYYFPGNNLGDLSGFNPTTPGINTYTASGLTLLPSTLYYVLVMATTPVAEGAYHWSEASADSNGWMSFFHLESSDGLSWGVSRQYTLQMALYATPVPEPSTAWLLLAGGGIFFYVRKRRST